MKYMILVEREGKPAEVNLFDDKKEAGNWIRNRYQEKSDFGVNIAWMGPVADKVEVKEDDK